MGDGQNEKCIAVDQTLSWLACASKKGKGRLRETIKTSLKAKQTHYSLKSVRNICLQWSKVKILF